MLIWGGIQNMTAKSIYDISVTKMDGTEISLKDYRGKVIMIVNTASKCGFTKQFAELQELWESHATDDFVILGFPSNNFMNQDPGSNEDILEFCQLNYGVSFPMFEKISVKGEDIHPLYKFLTEKESNPEFSCKISWNFNKFLIGKDGRVIARYSSPTKPMSKEILADLAKALK